MDFGHQVLRIDGEDFADLIFTGNGVSLFTAHSAILDLDGRHFPDLAAARAAVLKRIYGAGRSEDSGYGSGRGAAA